MTRSWLWLALLGGCGRLGFDAVATDGGLAADALVIPTTPFDPPQLVPNLNGAASDDDPTLTADMLEIVFDSERFEPEGDLMVSTRPNVTSAWSPPVIISELSEVGIDEDGPCITPDGLTLTFSSTRGANNIYETTRASPTAPWGVPTRLDVSSDQSDEGPAIDATSGRVLVFDSDRGGDFDLYFTTRSSRTAPFEAPVPLTELNTGASESDAWISPDLRTIFFVRGLNSARELYFATR